MNPTIILIILIIVRHLEKENTKETEFIERYKSLRVISIARL